MHCTAFFGSMNGGKLQPVISVNSAGESWATDGDWLTIAQAKRLHNNLGKAIEALQEKVKEAQ
jgi:hypothetical protein